MKKETNTIEIIKEIEDYLIPQLHLDAFERGLYYYLFRHSRLIGKPEVTVSIASLQSSLAYSKTAVKTRLHSLHKKGCIEITGTGWTGTKIKLLLPGEIHGCVPLKAAKEIIDIETIDFYNDPNYRKAIFTREKGFCFYCLKRLTEENNVLDHVQRQIDEGRNSYRNLVAACHSCNSSKGAMVADDFVRSLYRRGVLNDKELEQRLTAIEKLRQGELKPEI
jgi:hypothetical protein